MSALMDRFGGYGMALLALGWMLSAPLGMVYWGAKGWLLGVVLSLLLPWFGLVSAVGGMLS